MQQHADQLAIHGKGLIAAGTTAVAGTVSWLDLANQYVDLFSGVMAGLAATVTIAWYVYRFYKLHRGGDNDTTDTSE